MNHAVDEPGETREESDSLGTVSVPLRALTARTRCARSRTSACPRATMADELELVAALAYVKAAAARANLAAGELPPELAAAIVAAAHEVATGAHRESSRSTSCTAAAGPPST